MPCLIWERLRALAKKLVTPPPPPTTTLEDQLNTQIWELDLSNAHYINRNTRDLLAIELCDYYLRFNADVRRATERDSIRVYDLIDALCYSTARFISRNERDCIRIYLIDYKKKLANTPPSANGFKLTSILYELSDQHRRCICSLLNKQPQSLL